ncbi:hypothetical protein ACFVT2_38015 [Streptomyces sp. NPDC058000]|uniref:hypothetical protein n=1 Tax=Streptomyces sp. NPDC058000 TaxID=3346299 RepID=UPI0036F0F9EA
MGRDTVREQAATPLSATIGRMVDVLVPQVRALSPKAVEFVVGTQINAAPHLGTHLAQTCAFLLAEQARAVFGLPTEVRFHLLDNAVHESLRDDLSGSAYQRSCFHALGPAGVAARFDSYYRPLFDVLADKTGVGYAVDTYSELQAHRDFRCQFLHTLARIRDLAWWLAPSTGVAPVRVPCPACGWAQTDHGDVRLVDRADDFALFRGACHAHGPFDARVEAGAGPYIGLDNLHRNLVKERVLAHERGMLRVMVKGSDWATACPLLDRAHAVLATAPIRMPTRIFTPLALFDTGAQFSKSLIREAGGTDRFPGIAPWMLSVEHWHGTREEHALVLHDLALALLADVDRFDRAYTATELARLIGSMPTSHTGAW